VLPIPPVLRLPINASFLVVIAISALVMASSTVHAQESNGKVCVQAFSDTVHKNGFHDPGEALLSDVGVNLMVNQNVIIANYVTDGKEPFCFSNLTPQQYTVTFSSPLYEATTSTGFTFSLAPGEAPLKEFGAVPKTTPASDTASTPDSNAPMTTQARIGLAAAGAVIAMVFFAGLGLIIYALFMRR
jgi:hypothetical protein